MLALVLAACTVLPSLAADDLVIYDYSNKTVDEADSFGWVTALTTNNGIPAPGVTVADKQLTITPQAGNFWAGTFGLNSFDSRAWVTELATGLNGGEYSYIRFYVKNTLPGEAFKLSFGLQNYNEGGWANNWGAADFSKAKFFNKDGSAASLTVSPDYNGYQNGYVNIPNGFEGYIFISASLNDFPTHTSWGTTALSSFEGVNRIEIDVREAGECDGTNSLVLGEIVLTKTTDIPSDNTGSQTGDKDDSNNGGDASILLYAAAAISGLGALTLRKKK